jgi:hypothetical protein
VRLAAGLRLAPDELAAASRLAAEGLLQRAALRRGIARLTLDGRLMADRVARDLLAADPRADVMEGPVRRGRPRGSPRDRSIRPASPR